MSQSVDENLSALVDGELPAEASRFLIARVGGEADLGNRFGRYHLMREVLRHGGVARPGLSLAERVQATLATEPAPKMRSSLPQTLLRYVAGGAVAAAVAITALRFDFGPTSGPEQAVASPATEVRPMGPRNPMPVPAISSMPAAAVSGPLGPQGAASARPWLAEGQALERYLMLHGAAVSGAGNAAVLPYVNIIVAADEGEPTATGPSAD